LATHTTSDTEVVLEMYKKHGPKCLEYFNGMFALVIYNEKTRELFAARDRLGIKPLYYRMLKDGLLFSSEISAVLHVAESPLDPFGIRQYRKLRMTLGEWTIYKDIKMFPAAHYWLNGRFTRYWDLDCSKKAPPGDDELRWLIQDAVRLRTRSDVPVGSYLSGGLDSTVLSCILKPDDTWTVGFPTLNEFEWAKRANEQIGSDHHQMVVDNETFLNTALWMIRKRQEPLSVPNEVLLYLMTLDVKKKNTVILSGEGADELFWGYDRIFRWAGSAPTMDRNQFDRKYAYGTHPDDEVLAFALDGLPGETVLEQTAYFFQIHHLHGLLRRLDNATMLCSVEARVPFVDHRLVDRLAGVPPEWRMGTTPKEPLKRAYAGRILPEIIAREKVGFPVPLDSLFSEPNPGSRTGMDRWLDFNLNEIHATLS
jgi:asparagine synthase (glutamine-hydrolysing)